MTCKKLQLQALMKEEGKYCNDCPLGRVTEAVKSEDGRVEKVHVAIVRNGQRKVMFCPIKELILLVPADGIKQDAKDGQKE